MKARIRLWLVQGSVAVMLPHFLFAVGWGLYTQSIQQAVGIIVGAALGAALVWCLYGVSLACLWLRRKQLEGDELS